MKIIRSAAILLFVAGVLAGTTRDAGGSGHWEGTIQIAKTTVAVSLDLAQGRDGQWVGTLAMPGQKLTEVAVSSISIKDGSVYFESRESLFAMDAKLSADNESMAGNFQSAFLMAVPVPVRLHRVSEPNVKEPPSSSVVEKDLAGGWHGVLAFGNGWEPGDQRAGSTAEIRVKLANGPAGPATGTFKKPGTKEPDLALSVIQQSGSHVRFEVRGAGASFTGELKNGELAGEWRQFDLDPVPLKLVPVDRM